MKWTKKNSYATWAGALFQQMLGNRYVYGLGLLAVGVLLTASLATYNPTDVSPFYYAPHGVVTNWCASAGAALAAWLLYLFGMSSWVLVVWCWYSAYYMLVYGAKGGSARDSVWALVLLWVTSAMLTSWYGLEWYTGILPGGVVGTALLDSLRHLFDTVGAVLLIHASLISCFFVLFPTASVWMAKRGWSLLWAIASWETVVSVAHATAKLLQLVTNAGLTSLRFLLQMVTGSEKILGHEQTVLSFEQIDVSSLYTRDAVIVKTHDVVRDEHSKASPQEQILPKNTVVENGQHAISEQQSPEQLSLDSSHAAPAVYTLPDTALFGQQKKVYDDHSLRNELQERSRVLEKKLERFGVMGRVTAIKEGPVVTLFEYEPESDTKISKIIALEDDLAMALQALSIRIIAPIPGRSVVGFEVANSMRKDVFFIDALTSPVFQKTTAAIPLILGDDTSGNKIVIDLARMPHLLVAGSTGSGKSVALNAMLISMLCALSPDELKLILIDPKRLEFAPYADIPHLLFPIVADPRRAAPVLKWVVRQMEERYEQMARCAVRNIADYNAACVGRPDFEAMPYIVVVIDELADLMMTAAREVEDLIARIAQMARAAGIHLLVATQRPSVDVITGLIKVNFPSRISFRVTSKVDSRTILDCSGAEKLLGRGDMLFLDGSSAYLKRVHGAYVSDNDIARVVNHARAQRPVQYLDAAQEFSHERMHGNDDEDVMYKEVLTYVQQIDEISISSLQRKFKIGFNRSARIIDMLEHKGIILPAENGKTRKVIR